MKTTNCFSRELNANEKMLALILSANIHGLIRDIDDLKNTSLYRQKLKAMANSFQSELEKHAHEQVWSSKVEGGDVNKAASQMDGLAVMHRNLMQVVLAMSGMHQSQCELFWQEMTKQFKRFNIPLILTPDGDLQVTEIRAEKTIAP